MERSAEIGTRSCRPRKRFAFLAFLLGVVATMMVIWAFLFDSCSSESNLVCLPLRMVHRMTDITVFIFGGETETFSTPLASDVEAEGPTARTNDRPIDMCSTNHCSQNQAKGATIARAHSVASETVIMQTDSSWKAAGSERIKPVPQSHPLPQIRKYASSNSDSISQNVAEQKSINDGNHSNKKVLNIHVIPHTHDDVGWLKTVDQLYNGWNNTIQEASVRDILTTVTEALEENPSRTFSYVEIKFFAMWWAEQPDSVRERVQKLVRDTKQLTFINGGWCMHDEATTHYMGMIDQTTLGHDFLKQTFDYVPTVGWQIDPFGHSSTQASLMTYKLGLNALYFGRIDYQDLELRHATKSCEGLWNTFGDVDGIIDIESEDEDREEAPIDEGSVFWGLTGSYSGNYYGPGGYCFDVECRPRKSFIDMNRTELIREIQDFLFAVRQQSDRTKGDHVMLTMGGDFAYQRASVNFANLDLLIGTVMRLQEDDEEISIAEIFGPDYGSVNIFYSSPEYYTSCKYNETFLHKTGTNATDGISSKRYNRNEISWFRHHLRTKMDKESNTEKSTGSSSSSPVEWSIKRDDFFPYSDCPNCFWTGYFTSRPSLKRFERFASSYLLAARQVESTVYRETSRTEQSSSRQKPTDPKSDDSCEIPIYLLEDAMGVLQHHDGVSGTSKQHVAYDYAKTLQKGIDALVPCTIRKLKRLLLGDKNHSYEKYLKDLTYCQLLNETKCGISGDTTIVRNSSKENNEKDMYVIVYNSLASNRSTIIDLPIGATGNYLVEDMDGGNSEMMKAQPTRMGPSRYGADRESFVLSFMASSLPAVGAKVFRIKKYHDTINSKPNEKRIDVLSKQAEYDFVEREDGALNISNGHFSVLVDKKTGSIRRIGTQEVGELSSWGYYTSFDSKRDAMHNDDDHNSGAYIFRPSTPNQKLNIVRSKNATIIHSSIGTEIHMKYEEPWIQTTTRIQKEIPYVEIEYQIGPVPISDGYGKEVVTRYNTGVQNKAIFYTDSNGREFIKRQRNQRPTWDLTVFEPIAGNYYPVNAAVYIDEHQGTPKNTDSENSGPAFAVVTDRSQGGGSILDGTIELMVHRQLLEDDHRGVAEPLNETEGITPCPPYGNATRIGEGLVIRGKHRILVEKTECENKPDCGAVGGARLARSVMDEAFADPLVFVASAPSSDEIPFQTKSFSGLKEPLPKNVMLITKRLLYNEEATSYLIRLGHQYGDSVNVDLSTLFPDESILEVQEMTLSANRRIDEWRNERFDWNPSESRRRANDESLSSFKSERDYTITLERLDIRTMIVKVKSI